MRQILLFMVLLLPTPALADDPASVDYARDIQPVLTARCYACHGPLKQEQGLRLDTVAAIRKGGDSGPAVEAHHPDASLLLRVVTGADGWQMPPEGEPLTPEQIAKIKAWIDAGAAGPANEQPAIDPAKHWAFQPPVRAALPASASSDPTTNPIDAFLAAERERHGLKPRPQASKEALIRRVYLDLIGMPPTPVELREFLADESAGAYERVVDRLLSDPAHAERWARHWMDIWRYSDWYGYAAEIRNSQPHIWRWRDWIVDSLAADKGYDQMVVEMLAGDELAPLDRDTLRATGYLVRNWNRYNRNLWLHDIVEHTGKAFLGLTFNCAQCHDHKYDPIAQSDFYRLRAFFEPHDIRTDVVAGQPLTEKDGLVRAYDAHHGTPTYLFTRGDERDPDKSQELTPGLPAVFGDVALEIQPVQLPLAAWYPSLDPVVQETVTKHLTSEVTAAKQIFDEITAKLAAARERHKQLVAAAAAPAADPASAPAANEPTTPEAEIKHLEAEQALAARRVAKAEADLVSFAMRTAAGRAKTAQPPGEDAPALALAAGLAERSAKVADAELKLLAAEQALVQAQGKLNPNDEATKKPVAAAEAKLAEAKKAVDDARAAQLAPSDFTPYLPEYPATSTGRRLALARWIVARDNPLTARVAVNHIWMRHFGQPLVSTVFDFGLNGREPTHPALLDWLAVELMENGWSMKRLHRMIVTSAAYKMESTPGGPDDPNYKVDPDNSYVWRMNSRRMDAEAVRDSLLSIAGALDRSRGGPELEQVAADDTNRRSLYYRQANEKRVVFLQLFDQPNVEEGYRRTESIVPQQALALLNSQFAMRNSGVLADKLWSEAAAAMTSEERQIRFVSLAYEAILSRQPTDVERDACMAFMANQSQLLAKPDQLAPFGAEQPSAGADPESRARAGLVHVLINHNDFVSIR